MDDPGGVGHLSNHLHAELKEGRGEVGLHVELLQADRVGHQLPPIIVGLALKNKFDEENEVLGNLEEGKV